MPLKGKSPKAIEKRLKVLFYGEAGAGKSTCAASFPSVYYIDTERGVENDSYVRLINRGQGVVYQTNDFDEVLAEVTALLSENHPYKTLVIDPFTVLYDDLLDKSEKEVGSDFGRHYSHSAKKVKRLMNLLLRLPMNVIMICHSKVQYGQNLAVLGKTYDGWKKLDYLFDLVFEVQKRPNGRVGIVKKSRIESFKEAESFPFCYEEIASKYGKEILERDAIPEKLANTSQVNEIKRLVSLLKVPGDTVDKWLSKAKASSYEEMNTDDIQKCIDHLNKQVMGDGNA